MCERLGESAPCRFVCREPLGESAPCSAAYLTPIPADHVVYGSGDSAMILDRDQARALHSLGMEVYRCVRI